MNLLPWARHFLVGCVFLASTAMAVNEIQWRNPHPHGYELRSVAYGNSMYAAVGNGDKVSTSTNGMDWQATPLVHSYNLYSLCFGDDKFVAVGANGAILISTNGTRWMPQVSPVTNSLQTVSFGNGVFVAVGNQGKILSSANGINWVSRASDTTQNIVDVAFGSGKFVAVGPAGQMLLSFDGDTWTSLAIPTTFSAIAFGNGFFVGKQMLSAGPFPPTPYSWRSDDGINWTTGTAMAPFGSGAGTDIAFGNECFVAAVSTNVTISTNGTNWITLQKPAQALQWNSLTYGNDLFLAVGVPGNIWTSTNLSSWVERSKYASATVSGYSSSIVVHSNTAVVAASPILVSTNGSDFFANTYALPNNVGLAGAAYGDGTFVLVGGTQGGGAVVLNSTNGVYWTNRITGSTANLNDVTYANGLFVSVGTSGTIFTSPNGRAWTGRFSGTSAELKKIAFGSGKFVAVGASTILTSVDGITWEAQGVGASTGLWGIAHGNGIFVAVGQNGTILRSTNVFDWELQNSGLSTDASSDLFGVAYGNGLFLAVGNSGNVLVSSNGASWQKYASITDRNLFSVAFTGSEFLIGGNDGIIVQCSGLQNGLLRQGIMNEHGFSFSFDGEPNKVYNLQYSSDLLSWYDMFPFTNSTGTVQLLDTNAKIQNQRYYRVLFPQ